MIINERNACEIQSKKKYLFICLFIVTSDFFTSEFCNSQRQISLLPMHNACRSLCNLL
jgi:hypothetical protein